MLADANVMITGGAGSVGPVLVRRLLEAQPNVVRILDNNEPGIAALRRDIDDERCRYLVGDVRDRHRLTRAMEDIDVVVHAAGMKHVDITEYNPFEAVKTNVLGLQHAIDAAIDSDVQRFVFTSSDKAVNPANTMGTTKLLGEKLVTAANTYRGTSDIRLASVRFGNVVNSSHSVVPLFAEQIATGGPVTLTDSRMTRFLITYDGICDLVVDAIEDTAGGEVFIDKMPAVRIENLAEVMIQTLAPDLGYEPASIDVVETGARIGETLHEELMTEREGERAFEDSHRYVIPPEVVDDDLLVYEGIDGVEPVDGLYRSSKDAPKLSNDAIAELLDAAMTDIDSTGPV